MLSAKLLKEFDISLIESSRKDLSSSIEDSFKELSKYYSMSAIKEWAKGSGATTGKNKDISSLKDIEQSFKELMQARQASLRAFGISVLLSSVVQKGVRGNTNIDKKQLKEIVAEYPKEFKEVLAEYENTGKLKLSKKEYRTKAIQEKLIKEIKTMITDIGREQAKKSVKEQFMNIVANTERPKLKLNLATKSLALDTNASTLVAGSALKKVVVFEKPKSDVKDVGNSPATSDNNNVATAATKSSSKAGKKSKKQEATASNEQVANSTKTTAKQKVVAKVATPEEILKEKIKRRKKEYFNILTTLKADFPEVFSEEPKPLAIGIDLELKKILNGEFANAGLSRFFHRYCGSFKYKEKLVEGARRFNLDGTPASLVTAKEVPVMISRPKFVKKPKDIKDLDKNDNT